jgi:hypothetical protein
MDMKVPDAKLIAHMIAELEAPTKRLSSWEENFVISVADQFERNGRLSDKQALTLEKIYAEKTE